VRECDIVLEMIKKFFEFSLQTTPAAEQTIPAPAWVVVTEYNSVDSWSPIDIPLIERTRGHYVEARGEYDADEIDISATELEQCQRHTQLGKVKPWNGSSGDGYNVTKSLRIQGITRQFNTSQYYDTKICVFYFISALTSNNCNRMMKIDYVNTPRA
jgi:hypothetical protein